METTWKVGPEDRGPDGKILVNPFEAEIARAMTDVGAPAPPSEQADEAPARPGLGRKELAGAVGGLVLAIILIAALNTFAPAPAPRIVPTATIAPTRAPLPTPAPTVALQEAYAAPGGAVLGTVPQTVTLRYQNSAYPGWGGFDWDGGIKWVRADAAQLAGLEDLAPPTPPPPPAYVPAPPIVEDAPPPAPASRIHERPNDAPAPPTRLPPTPSAR